MTRFNYLGSVLELRDGFSLSLTRQNQMFGIEKVEQTRTTNFKIPRTLANDKTLSLAHMPQTAGTKMRIARNVQMDEGVYTTHGNLHISQYDAGEFSAVFVEQTEFVQYARLANAGKLADIFTPADLGAYNVPFEGVYSNNPREVWSNSYVTIIDPSTKEKRRVTRPTLNLLAMLHLIVTKLGLNMTLPPVGNTNEVHLACLQPKTGTGDEPSAGDIISLYYNLPDIAAVDLFRVYAAINGAILIEEGGELKALRAYRFASAFNADDRVTKEGVLTRTIADYAQRNLVRDKGAMVAAEYAVDNKNIEAEKVLFEIPFVAGGWVNRGGNRKANVWLYSEQNNIVFTTQDDWGIGRKMNEGVGRQNPSDFGALYPIDGGHKMEEQGEEELDYYKSDGLLPQVPFIVAACEQATTWKVSIKMSLLEFMRITHDTPISYRGFFGIWHDAQYADGVGTFSLIKVLPIV